MSGRMLTIVTAAVDPDRVPELITGFQELTAGALPDGLLRSELLQTSDGRWHIATLWRDREALDAMRAAGPPAAPTLFRSVGGEPTLEVCSVAAARESATG